MLLLICTPFIVNTRKIGMKQTGEVLTKFQSKRSDTESSGRFNEESINLDKSNFFIFWPFVFLRYVFCYEPKI